MSNPAYATMSAFERPRSAGGGLGAGGFIPPPPGASQGGEPGQYPPFQQAYPSPYNWPTPNSTQLQPQFPAWGHNQSSQPQQFHPPPQLHQPSLAPRWTYDHHNPPSSLQEPFSAPGASGFPPTPVTPNAVDHHSPYFAQYQQPPPMTAPAQFAPWSQYGQDRHQPQHSPAPVPFTDERFNHLAPKPFGGSANAPQPKKSALKRPGSQSTPGRPSKSRAHSMHRSTSTGLDSGFGESSPWPSIAQAIPAPPSLNAPGYARGDEDTFTAKNLSHRPRDWRADYFPKHGISSYLPKIGRVRSDVEEYIDTVKRKMHPLLHHSPDSPPLAFDLRFKVVDGNGFLFQHLGRNYNEMDLAQLAAYPAAPMLRLYHPRLPWYIDVHQSHTNGVTVFDVLVQLSLQMQTPIHNRHYYTETLDTADRDALGARYKERIKRQEAEKVRGILQVDFLGEKFVMEGLVRGKQGMWEVKTRREI